MYQEAGVHQEFLRFFLQEKDGVGEINFKDEDRNRTSDIGAMESMWREYFRIFKFFFFKLN